MREAIASTADASFGTATNKVIAAFVQKDDSEAVLLHQIIWEAAAKACTEITKEKFDVNQRSNIVADALIRNQDLSREILAIEFTIDKTFFDAPHRHPQVLALRDFFAKWLQLTFEINETDAKNKAGAFPRIFLRELVQSDKDKLIKIKAFFNHPVFEAYEKDFRQEIYHGKLMQEYKCTAFGDEAIPLSELYIKPFFTVFEHLIKDKENKKDRKNRDFEQPFHSNDIDKKETGFLKPINNINTHDFFEAWLENTNVLELENGAGNLMLLFGQPGQGKTSFCSHTMYHLLLSNSDKNIYFYRLRDFEGTPTEFIEKPLDVLRDLFTKQVFNGNKMVDDDWHNSLLILDGLDELLMNKSMNNEQIRQLLSNLKRDIHHLQSYQTEKQLKCLVTSRHHYVPLEFYKTDKWLIISLDNLRCHQQQEWINKYSTFIKNQDTIAYLENLNDTLVKLDNEKDKKGQELRNLANQPILLTLIAQSEVQLDLSTDRANIYGKMFDTLQNRAWETDQIPNLQKLKADEKVQKLYRLFLQRLALHIYHSKNEYVRRSDFDTSGTKLNETFGLLKNRFSVTEFNIEQVLSSFYFKQVVKQYDNDTQDENHNYAFEFLHKSLQEYLVAEAIWNYSKQLLNKNEYDDYSKKR